MKPGQVRFDFQIDKIKTLFEESKTVENQSLWLYLHDLRTPVFMLEGLAKLYASLYDDNYFEKIKDKFKLVEDALGALDYYASFQKELSANPEFPASLNLYFQQKTNEKIDHLQQLLEEDNWLNGKQLQNISKKLGDINWEDESVEKELLTKFYKKQIRKINEFVSEVGFPLHHIEDHVHELRRKIRWLSIYPQAIRGAIILQETKPKPQYLKKYLTPEIVNSPFNVLPVSDELTAFLTLDKNKFLALSWMIAELGKLKDKGLKINALKEAFQTTMLLKDKDAYAKAYNYLGEDYPHLDEILEMASNIAQQYFEENNLDFILE
ncbi:MAG: hypothetical protein V4683_07135 [Bacteroidota bacterium]